jgi:hypothetical protein
MIFLPIIARELRVRARRPATYWLRFTAVSIAVTVCLAHLVWWGNGSGRTPAGKSMFNGLVMGAFLLTCLACFWTSDAITSERREGTLGLLLLTRVRAFDLVVGKLASLVLTGLCALVAFLPVLMISVVAGGVTGGEAFRSSLALSNALFLSLAIGFYASTLGPDRSNATRKAALLVVFFFLALRWLSFLSNGIPFVIAAYFSPMTALAFGRDVSYSSGRYWMALVAVQSVAWLLLARATVRLRRLGRNEGVATPDATADLQSDAVLRVRRFHQVDMDPIQWLMKRRSGFGMMLWVASLIAVGYSILWGPFYYRMFSPVPFPGMAFAMMSIPGLAVSIVTGVIVAWVASRFFVDARRTGELELLLTTPVGTNTIVSAQWQSLKRRLYGPLALMTLPIVISFGMLALRERVWNSGGWYMISLNSMLLGGANSLLSVIVICWLGLWYGLTARNQVDAVIRTVGLAKGVPYLIQMLGPILIAPAFAGTPYFGMMPGLAVLVFNLAMIRFARRRLAEDLGINRLGAFFRAIKSPAETGEPGWAERPGS